MPSFHMKTEKRVCFWGAPREVSKKARLVADVLEACGQNTGNLFIGNGLYSALDAPIKEYWNIYEHEPAEFDDAFDILVIPASNFLFRYTDLSDQEAFFSKTKAQIFMFGLGSQTKHIAPIQLVKGTERFIKMVADRGASIGVRGNITAEIMNLMGFKNVDVVGCPSMLSIPDMFKSNRLSALDLIAGNFTNNSREHSTDPKKLADVESKLFNELVRADGYYVLQNERHELATMGVAARDVTFDDNHVFHLNKIRESFGSTLDDNTLAAYLLRRGKIFREVKEWVTFMAGLEFSFGTRFHGNVAAILAGVPCYAIAHDLRTRELCELYAIPHSRLEDSSPSLSCAEMYSRASMDRFSSRFVELCEVWSKFSQRNGFSSHVVNNK